MSKATDSQGITPDYLRNTGVNPQATPVAPLNKDEVTEREKIRRIWRPLYDLGYKGAEQIDAQYMALLITQAVDETQALLNNQIQRELEELLKPSWTAEQWQSRIEQLIRDRINTLKDKVK